MKCPIETQTNLELLFDYCSGRLNSESAAALLNHLELCTKCRAFVQGQQTVWAALDQWEPAPVSMDFDRRLYQRIEQKARFSFWQKLMRPLHPMFLRPAFPLAALGLVLLAGALIEQPYRALRPSQPRVETVEAEQVERTLEDLEMLRQLGLVSRNDSTTKSM